ncbi:MAG: DUF72 domain-containing protein [Candidatus Bathyarchaeia archaeon]
MGVLVGCAGFAGGMERYFRTFSVVEIQSTFYKLPMVRTIERWRRLAPSGFEFTVKCSQIVTHPATSPTYRRAGIPIAPEERDEYGLFRPTDKVFDAWERTRRRCEILRAKVCLLQCPASFRATDENIRNMSDFLSSVDRGGMTIVWEPRGRDWTEGVIRRLCERLHLSHVVDPFAREPAYVDDLIYYRLHGKPPGESMYRHQYDNGELLKLADKVKDAVEADLGLYLIFNNLSMFEDAARFKGYFEEGRFPSTLPSKKEDIEGILKGTRYPADLASLISRFGWRLIEWRGKQIRLRELLRRTGQRSFKDANDVLQELERAG